MIDIARSIFQAPPFPGGKNVELVRPGAGTDDPNQASALLAALRTHRVGGKFWLPPQVDPGGRSNPWRDTNFDDTYSANDPAALLQAIVGRRVSVRGGGNFSQLSGLVPGTAEAEEALRHVISRHLLIGVDYLDPFTGHAVNPLQLVETLGAWRVLIDANQPIAAAFGFANWKRDTVAPLLWGGRPVPFRPAQDAVLATLPAHAAVAVWKARVPQPFLEKLETGPWQIVEIEDGFIRSVGLGAECIPPLSIVVDDLGIHYDPARPNRLETLLSTGDFEPDELDRARRLRQWLVKEGVGKYHVGSGRALPRPGGERRHVLVAGQVEDDRSVLLGGGQVRSNLELLRHARALAPNAYIIYRPHPDVEAGYRRGAIPERTALQYADLIDAANPISALIAMSDEVHVITSLTGFEALLHGKAVTTHGTPFYAGWGLTSDCAKMPIRRGKIRTLDELTAAVLLNYPRYLDPLTNLPCPPEILVMRLLSGVQRQNVALVPLRRLVGWARRTMTHISRLR